MKEKRRKNHLSSSRRNQQILSHPAVNESISAFLHGNYDQAIEIISKLETDITIPHPAGASSGHKLEEIKKDLGEPGNYPTEFHEHPESSIEEMLTKYSNGEREHLSELAIGIHEYNQEDKRLYTLLLNENNEPNCIYRIKACVDIANRELAKQSYEVALKYFKSACVESNKDANPPNNVGFCYLRLKNYSEAMSWFYKAHELNPEYHIPIFNIGVVYKKLNDLEKSEQYLRLSIAKCWSYPSAYLELAYLLNNSRQEEAECYYKLATLHSHLNGEAFYMYGCFLQNNKRYSEATKQFSDAEKLQYRPIDTFFNIGICERELGNFRNALEYFNKSLEIQSNYNVHISAGYVYTRNREYPKAFYHYEKALELNQTDLTSISNLIYTCNFGQSLSIEEELKWAKRWEKVYSLREDYEQMPSQAFSRLNPIGRKLRIGFISSEIGAHAISKFITPILENLCREQFIIYLYEGTRRNDSLSSDIINKFDQYYDGTLDSDKVLTEKIRTDNIDVLIDTSAHMRCNRMGVISRRAAPVQVHYIGYHGTTGISNMDYFFGDSMLATDDTYRYFTEQFYKLNRTWVCYSVELQKLPSIKCNSNSKAIVFGSFNNLEKVSEFTIFIWSKVLNLYPNSILILKDGLSTSDTVRERIIGEFEKERISASRISFRHYSASWDDHMELYNEITVALDTYPLNSGTTAFDALAMGVPVIAYKGITVGSRLSASILKGLGKSQWIASDPDQYCRIINMLLISDDSPLKLESRLKLRQDFLNSELCDGKSMAESVSTALKDVFTKWFNFTNEMSA